MECLRSGARVTPRPAWYRGLVLGLVCLLAAAPAAAQAQPPLDGPQAKAPTDDTIARPAGPLLVREPDGRVIVRATRITEPMRIDGRLDEAVYREIPPITDFIQQEPDEGAPATEKTEAWILFDDENIYVMCRCWDSNPGAIVANDMRRDSPNINTHDTFGVQFDPYHDGRGSRTPLRSRACAFRRAGTTSRRAVSCVHRGALHLAGPRHGTAEPGDRVEDQPALPLLSDATGPRLCAIKENRMQMRVEHSSDVSFYLFASGPMRARYSRFRG